MQAESVAGEWHALVFGDTDTFATGDAYATILIASTENAAAATLDDNHFAGISTTGTTAQTNHYLARAYTGLAGSVAAGKYCQNFGVTVMATAGLTYPASVDNGLHMEPIRVVESTTFRGVMPGVYCPLHTKPLTHYQEITDVVGLSGRTLMAVDLASPTGTATAQCLIDITGPWR